MWKIDLKGDKGKGLRGKKGITVTIFSSYDNDGYDTKNNDDGSLNIIVMIVISVITMLIVMRMIV